jgi:hypothetical protein
MQQSLSSAAAEYVEAPAQDQVMAAWGVHDRAAQQSLFVYGSSVRTAVLAAAGVAVAGAAPPAPPPLPAAAAPQGEEGGEEESEEEGEGEGANQRVTQTRVTAQQWTAYRVHEREGESTAGVYSGRLWQEFAVDQFCLVSPASPAQIAFNPLCMLPSFTPSLIHSPTPSCRWRATASDSSATTSPGSVLSCTRVCVMLWTRVTLIPV